MHDLRVAAPEETDEHEHTPSGAPPAAARNSRASRPRKELTGGLAGGLALCIYLALLARGELDAALGGLPLPQAVAGWRVVVLALGVALAATLGAALRRDGLRLAAARRWLVLHSALLTISAITLAGLGLRLFGIAGGLPYIEHPDEPAVADRALQMLRTGDLNPHYFVYSSLYYYMQAAVYALRFLAMVSSGAVEHLDDVTPVDFYLWGRILTAVLGALTIPLVYLGGRRLYGTAAGLIAALFIATNTISVFNSNWITTDVPAGFFSALAMVAIFYLLPRRDAARDTRVTASGALPPIGRYLFAGAAIGLAIGTKYNSALLILPLVLAHGFLVAGTPGNWWQGFLGRRLWAALGAAAGAFLLSTPFAILDLPTFLNDVASVIAHYRYGHAGHESDANWIYYVQSLLRTDFLPTVLTLVGVVVACVRHRRADVVLLAFPLAFYLSMSSYRVNFEHNLTPILPFTAILAALGLSFPWRAAVQRIVGWRRSPGRRNAFAAAMLGLAVVPAIAVAPAVAVEVRRGYLYSQPDNRARAERWLDENARPHAKIWLEPLTPALDGGRYVTGHGEHVVEHPLEWYVANRYEYLVLSAGAYKDVVYDRPERNPALRDAYLRFFEGNKSRLVAAFNSNKVDSPGPTILIYATGYQPPRSAAEVRAGDAFSAILQEGEGGRVELIGADYPRNVAAGTHLPIVLYWHTLEPLRADYTVFVHLIDEDGNKPVQRDTGPLSGTYPTSQWSGGEIVVDEAGLDLPANLAPGTYSVRAGMYQQLGGGGGPALPVVTDRRGSVENYVLLGPISVEPPQ